MYDVTEEGTTLREFLRDKHRQQHMQLEIIMSIFEFLREGSDYEVAGTLARLRTGTSIDEEYEYLSDKKAS